MQVITQPGALHALGIFLRSHNGEAFETIPPHWAAFGQALLAARLPHRLSDDVYSACTNFENHGFDHSGRCTLVIGNAVPGHWVDLSPKAEDTSGGASVASRGVSDGKEILRSGGRRMAGHLAVFERHQPDGSMDLHIGVLQDHGTP